MKERIIRERSAQNANDAEVRGVGSPDRVPSEDSEATLRRGDERGEPGAATRLGLLLEGRGDLVAAEAAYRRAEQRGDVGGACNLGRLLERQDDLAGAKGAYRRADELGDAVGAFKLGRLLAEQGDLPAAAVAYRRAEKRGEPAGATSLGRLLEHLGDPVGAAAAYRRASNRGHAAGAIHLGQLLARSGELIGAETAYCRASELGDADGAAQLAKLRAERGERAGARAGGQRASRGHDVASGPMELPAPRSGEATAPDREKRSRGTAGRRGDGKRGPRSARWYLRRRFGGGATASAASKALGVSSSPRGRGSTAPEQAVVEQQAQVSQPAAVEPERAVPEPAAVEPERAVPEPVAVEPEPAVPEPVAVEPEPALPAVDPVRAERVKVLQRQLRLLGFDVGPVDGRYGPRTTDAVKHLQEAAALEPDGIVGPLTAEVLRRNPPEPPDNDREERVKMLQRQLSWLGFEPGPADGRYGPLTTGAVSRFQEAHQLPVDGIVDRATANVLRASVVQRPSLDRIDRIKALQRQLLRLGLDPGAIDGRYGTQTTEAVRRFQEDHDLPADGVVDPATQDALQGSAHRTERW